jgi:MarR family transcriptional regulator, transcriptional regulator for hemolysin
MLEREKSAGYMVNWLSRLFIRAITPRIEPAGISIGYMPVFFALVARPEGLTQKQLAVMAEVEQPTMAATLSRMERDGIIERTPDPNDKRSAIVKFTPAGWEKIEVVREAAAATNAEALAPLSADEREQFFEMMRRIVVALGGEL